ncbi:MAG: hypothetical protein C0613_03025 [Desulfobulbaceae bacterium]|nr:MAG: hypothetical protein C0613_03025 [Desulfobulbaceae bacterium]
MIYNYAIEPEFLITVAGNRRDYRHVIENFGLGTPRMMAEFPKLKKWRKRFRQATSSRGEMGEDEKKRLEELFKHLIETQIRRDRYVYDNDKSWLDNAENEHARHPFRAIVATKNRNNKPHILPFDNIGDWPDNFWSAEQGVSVERQADSMAQAIGPMLENSQEVIFVDPHFNASERRFRAPLEAFLERYLKNKTNFEALRIEIHCSIEKDNAPAPAHFKEKCKTELPRIFPTNSTVTIKCWKQRQGGAKLHNRFVLTDIGGVLFGTGLDTGQIGEKDDIYLMARDQYIDRWNEYAGNEPAFDLDCEVKVVGIKPV